MHMTRLLCQLLTGLCVAFSGLAHACEEAVVASRDGRYVVIDSRTLDMLDVGNVWWLGIDQISAVSGGSVSSAAGLWHTPLPPPPADRASPQLGFVTSGLLRASPSRESAKPLSEVDIDKAWWISGDRDTRLITYKGDPSEPVIQVRDRRLELLFEWSIPDPQFGLGFSCSVGDDQILVAGLRQMAVGDASSFRLSMYPSDLTGAGFQLTDVAPGCTGVFKKFPDIGAEDINLSQAEAEIAIVSLEENRLLHRSTVGRFSVHRVFDGGNYLIQQDLIPEPVDDGSFRLEPSTRLSLWLLRRSTADKIEETEMPTSGDMSRVYCPESARPALLFSRGNTVFSLDAKSMDINGSLSLPFDADFVF